MESSRTPNGRRRRVLRGSQRPRKSWGAIFGAVFGGLVVAAIFAEPLVDGIGRTATNLTSGGPFAQPTPAPQIVEFLPASESRSISLDRSFYVVVDASGSMNESECAGQFPNRTEAAKWAVKEFTTKRVPADVNLGLHVFDGSGSRERVPLGLGNRDAIAREIDRIRGGGNTPLNAAIREAVEALSTQRERQLGYGEFYVVVATDGQASDGDLRTNAVSYAAQQRIPLITIGFCLRSDHPLARASVSYRDANSPQDLLAALHETQGESPYFDATAFRRN